VIAGLRCKAYASCLILGAGTIYAQWQGAARRGPPRVALSSVCTLLCAAVFAPFLQACTGSASSHGPAEQPVPKVSLGPVCLPLSLRGPVSPYLITLDESASNSLPRGCRPLCAPPRKGQPPLSPPPAAGHHTASVPGVGRQRRGIRRQARGAHHRLRSPCGPRRGRSATGGSLRTLRRRDCGQTCATPWQNRCRPPNTRGTRRDM
jgi:hypothetical protein